MNLWNANKLASGSGEEGICTKRRETNCIRIFGAEIFFLEPERGGRAAIRALFPSTKQKHFYAFRACCQCTERFSGPRNVNATMLVQTVSYLLNCNLYLSVCNLWTAYFKHICLTIRNCLRWQLRYLFILLSLSSCPFPHSVLIIEKETWKNSAQIHKHLLISSVLFHRHQFALLPDLTSPSSLWPFFFCTFLCFFFYLLISLFLQFSIILSILLSLLLHPPFSIVFWTRNPVSFLLRLFSLPDSSISFCLCLSACFLSLTVCLSWTGLWILLASEWDKL